MVKIDLIPDCRENFRLKVSKADFTVLAIVIVD